ncbi:MAG TPA: PP2C family serine/threonine-protein phosphatase [Candidatus Acidoferrales bacterium]|jgi:hypothetical protein|nr:PP2C family serine/threonine-protein phosphatase [Candidatus Acidoferrales bacterium]
MATPTKPSPPAETPAAKIQWRIIGHSSRGASHLKSGLPNQDALEFWLPESGAGPPAILAIADGHGSAQHFRSADGARFAVESANALLLGFSTLHGSDRTLSELQAAASELPLQVLESWKAKIVEHLAVNPFRDEEFERLGEKEAEARAEISQNPLVAYGATLLSVLVTASYALCMQIGDGDILFVDDSGATTRPVPPDPRLIANQTTSLCQPEAVRDFRLHIEAPLVRAPALVLVSTDGYANSFRSDADFLQIGADFLAMARARGLDGVAERLPGILREASEKGSGDDVTFGIMRREDGEEDDMAEKIPKAELESLRTKIEARLQNLERRSALQMWFLIFALVLAVAALAVGLAPRMGAILPGNSTGVKPVNPPGDSPATSPPAGTQPKPATTAPEQPVEKPKAPPAKPKGGNDN